MTFLEWKELKEDDVVIYFENNLKYTIKGRSVKEDFPYFFDETLNEYSYITLECMTMFKKINSDISLTNFL